MTEIFHSNQGGEHLSYKVKWHEPKRGPAGIGLFVGPNDASGPVAQFAFGTFPDTFDEEIRARVRRIMDGFIVCAKGGKTEVSLRVEPCVRRILKAQRLFENGKPKERERTS